MSFGQFLANVGKMAFGYVGGFVLFLTGSLTYSVNGSILGVIVAILGAILVLFGVYTEREM